MSRKYSLARVSRSYSAWPVTKNCRPVRSADDVQPRQVGHRQGDKVRVLLDVLHAHLGIAGVGGEVVVVEAPHQGVVGV